MGKWIAPLVFALVLSAAPARAADYLIGLGVFNFVPDGVDVQLSIHPGQSHWMYAVKYTRWSEEFDDPFTGHQLTRSTTTMSGPVMYYLFTAEMNGTYYLGLSLLRWSRTETSLVTGESGSDSVIAPFFGGGYMVKMGKTFFFNAGLFLSPGTKLNTSTSVSSEESSGGFDIQLQLGFIF